MYRVSIELYKHEWKFGRTRNAVGTWAIGECFHRFFEFSQILTSMETLVKFWENSKTMWKHSPRQLMLPHQFSVSQASTLVSITRQKHGTCFLLHRYNLICWDWKCKTTVRRNTGEDCCFCSQETQNNQISGTKCSLNTRKVGKGVDL